MLLNGALLKPIQESLVLKLLCGSAARRIKCVFSISRHVHIPKRSLSPCKVITRFEGEGLQTSLTLSKLSCCRLKLMLFRPVLACCGAFSAFSMSNGVLVGLALFGFRIVLTRARFCRYHDTRLQLRQPPVHRGVPLRKT